MFGSPTPSCLILNKFRQNSTKERISHLDEAAPSSELGEHGPHLLNIAQVDAGNPKIDVAKARPLWRTPLDLRFAKLGQIYSKLLPAQVGPMSSKVGGAIDRHRPNLSRNRSNAGRVPPRLGETRPDLARNRPNLTNAGPMLGRSRRSGQAWPNLDRNRPKWTRFGAKAADNGQGRPGIGQIWSSFDQSWAEFD